MPSPVAHSLMGYCCYKAAEPRAPAGRRGWKLLAAFVLFSNLPDLHYIGGLLVGHPQRFHYYYLHTLLFGWEVAAILWAALEMLAVADANYWAASCFVLYSIHIVMDFFCRNLTGSSGLPLLWPFSLAIFAPPFFLFSDLVKGGLQDALSRENLLRIVHEICVMAVPILLVFAWNRFRRPQDRVNP